MERFRATSEIDPREMASPTDAPGRISDFRLIRAARRGSPDAAEEIVRRYWREAERTAGLIVRDQHAAQDIAQESLLRLLGSLERFDERKRLSPWLNRIVVNRSIDWIRKRPGTTELPTADEPTSPAPEMTDPELLDALHRLPLSDRVAVVMRAVLGYRAVEIAEVLGEPAGTTRSRIHRALKQLRTELNEQEEDAG